MRIMLDSNILVSAAIFKTKQMDDFVETIKQNTIVLTNIITDEAVGVIKRKFPHKLKDFTEFLAALSFDGSYIADDGQYDYDIRDSQDRKILHSAYSCSVDVLVTGDKDFFAKQYDGLEILTVTKFLEKYY